MLERSVGRIQKWHARTGKDDSLSRRDRVKPGNHLGRTPTNVRTGYPPISIPARGLLNCLLLEITLVLCKELYKMTRGHGIFLAWPVAFSGPSLLTASNHVVTLKECTL